MKILHIDIETAPNIAYIWGLWNQNINLSHIIQSGYTMCWAAKWHGEKKVYFKSIKVNKSGKIKDSKKMLKGIWELLNEADVVVHYNGKKFDIPTLNKEFLIHKMPPPNPYHQIDLLKVARKEFRFTSNKLDYVSQILGLDGKVKHIGFKLWVQCMAGCKKAWRDMEKYNKQDVVLLEEVYNKLLPWIKDHPNHALYTDTDRPVCPNCGSESVKKNGIETTKSVKYQRYKCNNCQTPIRGKKSLLTKDKNKVMLTQSKL